MKDTRLFVVFKQAKTIHFFPENFTKIYVFDFVY